MGAFVDIVRSVNARPLERFQIGLNIDNGDHSAEYWLTLAKKANGSEPYIQQLRWVFDDGEIIFV